MNETAYDERKMRAFLLGALTEEETELFDELSFTDDRFADALNASEKDLVDAYARGELSDAELESFENHYLASPMRREKAEFAAAFQAFAERKTAQTAAEIPELPKKSLFAGWNFSRRRGFAFQFGLAAATLLFLFLGVWSWLANRRLSEQTIGTKEPPAEEFQTPPNTENDKQSAAQRRSPEGGSTFEQPPKESILVAQKQSPERLRKPSGLKKQPAEDLPPQTQPKQTPPVISTGSDQPRVEPRVTIASIVLTPALRGDGSRIAELSISPETAFVDAQLELETDEFPAYRVALVDLSNRIWWRSDSLKAQKSGDGKTLTVRFPAKNLKPQIYSLVVSGVGAGGAPEQIGSYPFRVATPLPKGKN